MEKKIYINMCALAFVTILLTSTITLWAFYSFFSNQLREGLEAEAIIAAQSLNVSSDRENLLESFNLGKTNSRITLINPTGKVIFDSHTNPEKMANHADRTEVIQAAKTGTGEAARVSDIIGEKTFYHAVRLNDGWVIRLAATTDSVYAVFIKILPYLVLMGLIVFTLCAILAYRLTQKIVQPIYSIDLEQPKDDHGYSELAPLLLRINEQNRLIKAQIDSIASERDTINTIIGNMREGLVLLDRNSKILAVNDSALSLLGVPSGNFQGQNFWVLTRNITLGNSMEKALAGNHNDGIFSMDERNYHFFASPVYENNEINGAILLLFDVTEEQRTEKIRKEFSANVSHELKTPLTSISGYAEIIESGMATGDDVKGFAGKIKDEASRLLTLINDIIKLSQLDEAQGEKHFEPVNLLSAADIAAKRLQPLAEEHQVKVTVGGDSEVVKGEEIMIEEMIYNLIENSIKYNKPNGQVNVNVAEKDENVVLSVSDTGIGIPEDHHDRVFERFYRVAKSHSKKIGGTGLGLAIVKHIAQFHGAKLSLKSRENEGTTITVTFEKR